MSRTHKDMGVSFRRREAFRGMNRHHVHPRSRNGPDTPENIVVLDRRIHALIHDVFSNMTPQEYLPYAAQYPALVAAKAVRSIAKHFGIGLVMEAIRSLK